MRGFIFLFLILNQSTLAAETSSTTVPAPTEEAIASQSVSTTEPGEHKRSVVSGRVALQTSRAAGKDFRTFKGSSGGSEEGSGISDGSTMPNLNYVTGKFVVAPNRDNQFHLGVVQSLDSDEDRRVPTPVTGNRPAILPASIAALRYMHYFTRSLNASLGDGFDNQSKFSDPSVGLNYKEVVREGWGKKGGFSLSIPTTEKSHNDHILTKASLRTGLAYYGDNWNIALSLSHSRPFYQGGTNLSDYVTRKKSGKTASKKPRSTRPNPGGGTSTLSRTDDPSSGSSPGGNIADRPGSAYSSMEEVDLVLNEREVARSSASLNYQFTPSRSWKFTGGPGTTLLRTARENTIWMTSMKLLGVSYQTGHFETGSDINLYSNIHKFKSPSLPNLWNFGLHVSYLFGADPNSPRGI